MKVIIFLVGILTICVIALIMIEPKTEYNKYVLTCYGSETGYFLGNDSWVCTTIPYQKWGYDVIDTYSYDGMLHKFNFKEMLK